ncbi:hypothetical protein AX15_004038 [Amanita polypyramis BW_CC]|nr:hypothetical protein AX15_004038 [Amanita polypyramis BW_CC]
MEDMDVLVLSASYGRPPSRGPRPKSTSSSSLSRPPSSPPGTRLRRATYDSPQASAPTSPTMESDLARALQLILELSDHISRNQKIAASLQSQTMALKDQTKNTTSGFALRRFNVDLSKETFESEPERKNAQLIIENQSLLHENKQLNMLLKEYETTVETVMSKFRNHALAAQRHELTLTRHYEVLIHARETHAQSFDITSSIQTAQSLHRITFLLRSLLKCLSGEDSSQSDSLYPDSEHYPHSLEASALPSVDLTELELLVEKIGDDWASQRETEIARLERENEELRKMLKVDPQTMADSGVPFDLEQSDTGRTSIFGRRPTQQRQPSLGSFTPSGDSGMKLLWGEGGGQQQQGSGQGNLPPQSMPDFQPGPGTRMGSQVRRPGIIGGGQQRGLFVSGGLASTTGNGVGSGGGRTSGFTLGMGPPPSTGATPPALWSNPPAVSPAPPLVVERPWPAGPGLDLSR